MSAAGRFGVIFGRVENCQKFCDCQQLADARRQIEEFQLPVFPADGGVAGDQFPDAARIKVNDFGKVQEDFLCAFAERLANRRAQDQIAFAESDVAAQIENHRVAELPFGNIQPSHYYNCRRCRRRFLLLLFLPLFPKNLLEASDFARHNPQTFTS
jgi:hypothetical protein